MEILIGLAILVILILIAGYYFSSMIIKPKRLTYEDTMNIEFAEGKDIVKKE
ncbi:hypothetical protein GOQ27_11250 [Clostridium sp. D2Q-11]|uniref:Uncharacterized protein n=1 Tax=Anaeromonas frigoriresistens TaxID=2683708 RepID=A0A942UZ98_9FIRM|nr:hypothetical protein [Anaeromonas frigoriresistens]MBS4539041.1 hypothetical protein [Anaeromonas frigoriresistens]